MTGQPRPNLGGLFNGSTPPDRPSSIAGRLDPRSVVPPAGDRGDDAATPTLQREPSGIFSWFDPVKVIDLYFGVLHAVLDANRHFAVMLVTAPGSRRR